MASNNQSESSMDGVALKAGDLPSPAVAPKEAQINPLTPHKPKPKPRKRKLVFDDEPPLPSVSKSQCLDLNIEAGPSRCNNSNNSISWMGPPSSPIISPYPHYVCSSNEPDQVPCLNTDKHESLYRSAKRLFNAVHVCGVGITKATNANLLYLNDYNRANVGRVYPYDCNMPPYPFFPYTNEISTPSCLVSRDSTLHRPQEQNSSPMQNIGCSLAPETPEKTNHLGRHLQTESSYSLGVNSDGKVTEQEKQVGTPHLTPSPDLEGNVPCGVDSPLPQLIDPSSFVLERITENSSDLAVAEGEKLNNSIDLNKSPPQKPKRKKHRPLVVKEVSSMKKSKLKIKRQPSSTIDHQNPIIDPPPSKHANFHKETCQQMPTNEFDSVAQHASGMAHRNHDPPNLIHDHSHHSAVLNQEELLSQFFEPQEKVSDVLDSIEVARQMDSILSPSKKKAFRENYKTLARRKELVVVHGQVNASTLLSFPAKAQQAQLIKQKGKRRQSRKQNAENEKPSRDSSVHSICDSRSSSKGLYHRSSFSDVVDRITERLKRLELTEKAMGNSELVPYMQNGDIVPYEGPFDPLKKRKYRAQVDLDDETNRVFRLLMGIGSEDDKQPSNLGDQEKLEKDRELFRGRVESFIARMRLVQGDRRFSQWKGSVLDSVIGVFLTQNVSDHSSSSAFMSMASRFPPTEKSEVTISDSNNLRESGLEKRIVAENVSYIVQIPDQGPTDQIPGHTRVCNEIDELYEQNLKETSNSDESFASNPLGDKGSSPRVMNSTNGSESNSDIWEQPNESDWTDTFNDTHSFIELLSKVENRTLWSSANSEKQHDLVAMTTDTYVSALSIHNNQSSKPLSSRTPSSVTLDHSETHLEASNNHMIDFLGRHSPVKDQQWNVSSTQGKSLREDSINKADPFWSVEQEGNLISHPNGMNQSECQTEKAAELVQSSTPQNPCISEDLGLGIPQNHTKDGKSARKKVFTRQITGVARANMEMNQGASKNNVNWNFEWKKAVKFHYGSGLEKERDPNTKDAVNWEAVRCADVGLIAETIKDRGMNNVLAGRIKAFLEMVHKNQEGSLDLEWLKDIEPTVAKEILLSIRGLGLKSVECIRLLALQNLAFPVDTNVGRICVRLGWVPIRPLPESVQLHLLELYPVQASIQKYLWPRLSILDQRTLYELHYQMITFGKVFCTKTRPNCNSCPMRDDCKHFASAFASARLSLQGPSEESSSIENLQVTVPTLPPTQQQRKITIPSEVDPIPLMESSYQEHNCEPIIEEPATPEPEIIEDIGVNDFVDTDPDQIPEIKLNLDQLHQNLQQIYENNIQDIEDACSEIISQTSKALIVLSAKDASIPVPKLKNVSRLRTEHHVYEIPDSHPLLGGYEAREPDDPSPYLLAIWTPGETLYSTGEVEHGCSQTSNNSPCDEEFCDACTNKSDIDDRTVKGTILIPCRTAMRGSFPLNGTYFQVNEVFAEHETSLKPLEVPRDWIWNLPRRKVLFSTSIPSTMRGLSCSDIQACFWKGYVCVRGFERRVRAPRPLVARLHFPASKQTKTPRQQTKKNDVTQV